MNFVFDVKKLRTEKEPVKYCWIILSKNDLCCSQTRDFIFVLKQCNVNNSYRLLAYQDQIV